MASKGDFKENENSLSEEVTSESVEETSGANPVYHVDIMIFMKYIDCDAIVAYTKSMEKGT